MPLAWKRNTHDLPSEYSIDINGRPLTCVLCRMEEAQSTVVYDYIRTYFAKEVHAVGVAKGDKQEGQCQTSKYPDNVNVIKAPVYYQGRFRADGVETLWTQCKSASLRDKAIVIHCNHSFHRGPILLAAIMIKAGITKTAAFDYIAQKRTIYYGHCLQLFKWPLEQQQHHASEKFSEAHKWLEELECAAIGERSAAYSVCNAGPPIEDPEFCALEARLPSWIVEWPTGVGIGYVENPYVAALSDGRNLRGRHARRNNNIANQNQTYVENPLVAALNVRRNLRSHTDNANKNNVEKKHMDTAQTDGLHNFDDKSDANESPCVQAGCICCLKASWKNCRIDWLMKHFDAEELHLAALRKRAKTQVDSPDTSDMQSDFTLELYEKSEIVCDDY